MKKKIIELLKKWDLEATKDYPGEIKVRQFADSVIGDLAGLIDYGKIEISFAEVIENESFGYPDPFSKNIDIKFKKKKTTGSIFNAIRHIDGKSFFFEQNDRVKVYR